MRPAPSDNNELTGSVPTQLGRLQLYDVIYLYQNALSSTIPTQLGSYSLLETSFYLNTNEFTGPIPTQLGQLTSLIGNGLWWWTGFYLKQNDICGEVRMESSRQRACLSNYPFSLLVDIRI